MSPLIQANLNNTGHTMLAWGDPDGGILVTWPWLSGQAKATYMYRHGSAFREVTKVVWNRQLEHGKVICFKFVVYICPDAHACFIVDSVWWQFDLLKVCVSNQRCVEGYTSVTRNQPLPLSRPMTPIGFSWPSFMAYHIRAATNLENLKKDLHLIPRLESLDFDFMTFNLKPAIFLEV